MRETSSNSKHWLLIASTMIGVGLGGCAGNEEVAQQEGTREVGQHACGELLELSGSVLGEPTARIIAATLNPPSEQTTIPGAPPWANTVPAMPEHCEVTGVMRERQGTDGQEYRVTYRLRLPSDWNGRFLYEGGGGTNGDIGRTVGSPNGGGEHALGRGFAVVSSDTGHDNQKNNIPERQGQVSFAHDYEARLEYAEKALDSVATAGKAIVNAYYGKAAEHDYFAGCSNGGREGMVFAQRFPGQFDGILAAAPAFAVPKAAVAEAWDTQVFSKLAETQGNKTASGMPDMAATFSAEHFALVAEAVLEACDADDGIEDGLIQHLDACTTAAVEPLLRERECKSREGTDCLSGDQIDALVASINGPQNSSGQPLYASWPWDTGIADNGWRIWKIGVLGAMPAINTTLGATALSGLFLTPPETIAGTPEAGQQFQMAFDFDEDAPRLFATAPGFPRSSWDLVGAQSIELSAFSSAGGKMIVPHGGSDPIFSLYDTTNWWREVNAETGGRANDFVRVFAVPGQTHCQGGAATNDYDALGALIDWIEYGKAPDRIEATAGDDTPWPGRTRPLCPYPSFAQYQSGDRDSAGSFQCGVDSE